MQTNKKLKVLELFSGIGSQAKAIKNLNINAEFTQCEIDKYAIKAYNAIHGETFNYGDISKVKEKDIDNDIDLLVYGSPCQDFSICGDMLGGEKGSGTKSSLLWEVEKFVKTKPKYLLMENVKNLVSHTFKPTILRRRREYDNRKSYTRMFKGGGK